MDGARHDGKGRSEPTPGNDWQRQVREQAEGIAQLFIEAERLGQPVTRELKEITEGTIAPDYHGRTLVELLQNGHDAHPADRADGLVELALCADEGEHGVLYAANGGLPLTGANFEALCRIARSTKSPEDGIGHKGVGFKSVLHLCDSPEIFSKAHSSSQEFDGFRFRFAQSADFDVLAARVVPERAGFAQELRDNVSALQVPVVIPTVPDAVVPYGRRGFSTVIRLPLRSPAAREEAERQLHALAQSDAPFELFLDRLESMTLVQRTDGEERRRTFGRKVTTLHTTDGLCVQEILLSRGSQFIMISVQVSEAMVHDAIACSRAERTMSSAWEAWQGDATVSVAVPVDKPLKGRMYTFLPMGAGTRAPFGGYLNAPFFAGLDRRTLNHDIPWNRMLLDQAAAACARAAQLTSDGTLTLPDDVLLDLLCWYADAVPRLAQAFTDAGVDLDSIPFIPVLASSQGRTSLDRARLWKPASTTQFTPQATAQAGVADIISHVGVNATRLSRLETLAKHRKCDLKPRPPELAAWAERCAMALAEQLATPSVWADFYDDLSRTLRAEDCADHALLLSSHNTLVRPSTPGAKVFFPPELRTTATAASSALPGGLSTRLLFLHPGIPATNPATGRPRPGRAWLEDKGLVHSYRAESILDLIAEAMVEAQGQPELLSACLAAAFHAWRDSAPAAPGTPITASLLVPTEGGWVQADRAVFGPHWPGAVTRRIDHALDGLLRSRRTRCPSLQAVRSSILAPPAQLFPEAVESLEDLLCFLECCGVTHGLPLQELTAPSHVPGAHLADPSSMPWSYEWGLSQEEFQQWLACVGHLSPRRPHPLSSYQRRTPLCRIPGQEAFARLDDTSRCLYAELITYGLQTWPETALKVLFTAGNAKIVWPSPLAGFLRSASWFPQTTPGHRTAVVCRRLDESWLMPAGTRAPEFLSAQPAAHNELLTQDALHRLRWLGIRQWRDPASAPDRLRHLVALVRDVPATRHARSAHAFRKAYEEAWADLLPRGTEQPAAVPLTLDVLVQRSGALNIAASDGAEHIYLPDALGSAQYALLKQTPAPLLPLRDLDLAARVEQYLARHGATALRRASTADVQVTVDDLPLDQTMGHGLLDTVGRWLVLTMVGLLELAPKRTPRDPAPIAQKLTAVRYFVAGRAETLVEGHPTSSPDRSHSLVVTDATGACIVSVPGPGTGSGPWSSLQAASTAITTLLDLPHLADTLRLHLIDLAQRCPVPQDVTPADVAHVLGLDLAELHALAPGYEAAGADIGRLLPLLVCLDADMAEQLNQQRDTIATRQELVDWLTGRLPDTRVTAEHLLSLADTEDLRTALEALHISLQQANRLWRIYQYPLLHSTEGHRRQFSAWLQRNRGAVDDRLRDVFTPLYQAGEDLRRYVELSEALTCLTPDPAWLDVYWDLDESLLQAHTDAWVTAHTPPSAPSTLLLALPSVAELRHTNRDRIRQWLEQPEIHFPVSLSDGAAPQPRKLPSSHRILRALQAHGLLDFEELTPQVTERFLRRLGLWTTQDNAVASTVEEDGFAHVPQKAPTALQVTDSATLITPERLPAFAETFARQLGTVRSTETFVPAPRMPQTPPKSPVGTSPHVWVNSTPYDTARAQQIGLMGEIVAGAWLQNQYGVPLEESWVSGFRSKVFNDGRGDDGLGYDFMITSADARHYFEVKASEGDDYEFELGVSQVSRARALEPDETYTILYVSHVTDEVRRLLTRLPNPFTPQGMRAYQLVSETRRLRFTPTAPPDA
ncbi:hypothetical protein [Streptomyces sp. NPDC046805]|uniref:sacsin N-terminal ATP-binding-like domain-containing protein n=1 Tax=Streptomyces sp. NPDC046805 TaxID=3155134 RepID=UPI0033C4B264